MKKTSLIAMSEALSARISDRKFLEQARKIKTAFTRRRKMPFCDIIYFIMSCSNRSLQRELDEYFHKKGEETVSRQGFSEARENIKHEAFIELNELLVQKFEQEDGEIATYRGYRLFSTDGSLIDLPNTKQLRDHFGYSSNNTDKVFAKGLAFAAFDVLNKIIVFAELFRYDDSEKRRMLILSDEFAENYKEKSIWLLDRGYPSFELYKRFEKNSQDFLIRVSSRSSKEINEANEPDQIVTITKKSQTVTLRVVNVVLSTGEIEKLVTSLSADFTTYDLKELYAKRWGIETEFRFLKHKTYLEVFTGESVTAVMQDFHSSILVLNMAAIAEREQEDILRENNAVCRKGKNKGCLYHPNKTKLIGDIKRDFVSLMLCDNSADRVFKQFLLYKNIKRYAFLDIPDRHFPRTLLHKHVRRASHPKSAL